MEAMTFDEWLEENNVELWSGEDFARLAWDAAIKSLEGVQTQPTNNARAEICPLCAYATSVQDTEGCPKCGGTGKLSPVA